MYVVHYSFNKLLNYYLIINFLEFSKGLILPKKEDVNSARDQINNLSTKFGKNVSLLDFLLDFSYYININFTVMKPPIRRRKCLFCVDYLYL